MAYTLQDSYTAGTEFTGANIFNNAGFNIRFAISFQAGSSYTLTAIECYLKRYGTSLAGKNISAHIYAASASPGNVGALLASSTNTIDGDDVTTAGEWTAKFTFAGLSITSPTWYWVAIHISAQGDASNYVRTFSAWTGANGLQGYNGSSWASYGDHRGRFRTYSGTANGGTDYEYETDGVGAEFVSSLDFYSSLVFGGDSAALFTAGAGLEQHYDVTGDVSAEFTAAATVETDLQQAIIVEGDVVWLGCEAGLDVVFNVYNDNSLPLHDWGVGDDTYSASVAQDDIEEGTAAFEGAVSVSMAIGRAPVGDAAIVASAAASVEFVQGISLSGQVVGVYSAEADIYSAVTEDIVIVGDAALVAAAAADVVFAVVCSGNPAMVCSAGAFFIESPYGIYKWGQKHWGTFRWRDGSTTNMESQGLAVTTFTSESVPSRGAAQDGAVTETDQDGAWTEPPLSGAYTQDDAYVLEIKPRTVATTEGKPTT